MADNPHISSHAIAFLPFHRSRRLSLDIRGFLWLTQAKAVEELKKKKSL
ncbi:MAG: hypothetical protein ACLQVX_20365 [Limisphaerales bacterium]